MKIHTSIENPTTVTLIQKWSENKIKYYAEKMPEGQFLNGHNDNIENADGIVMLLTGDICPVFRGTVSCLNPIMVKDDLARLSMQSVAGNFTGIYPSIEAAVEKYNRELYEQIYQHKLDGFGRYAIVSYLSFREDW